MKHGSMLPFLLISVVFGALVQLLGGFFLSRGIEGIWKHDFDWCSSQYDYECGFVYACGPLGAAIATSLSYMLILGVAAI